MQPGRGIVVGHRELLVIAAREVVDVRAVRLDRRQIDLDCEQNIVRKIVEFDL